ncbi:esterase/lipase family protein [Streptomyces huiliensis]|uniref:esterase/lipase family protein n=1 Tax=Streptomyces huiliensis TaxID=2876027 RepID=UPI003557AC1F|nr:alpha/beta fold hydrolase [Streptomyces huiliensis]
MSPGTGTDTGTGAGASTAPASASASASARPGLPARLGSGGDGRPCKPSAAHPRPVVLVHGTWLDSAATWPALAGHLTRRGYCVFALDYGRVPDAPGLAGLGPIDRSARELASFVRAVLATTRARQVDIVGHSQGGLMPRYYLRFLGGAREVHTLVGLAPSNHGTAVLGLPTLTRYVPATALLLRHPAVRQQLAGSAFLRTLNRDGDTVPGVRYTVIATRFDETVVPYRSQFLTGPNVDNILIQDVCPVDPAEHWGLATADPVAFRLVTNALDPSHAAPATCVPGDAEAVDRSEQADAARPDVPPHG